MDVIATKKGFYGRVIKKGVKFALVSRLEKGSKEEHNEDIESQFSSEWMERAKVAVQSKADQKATGRKKRKG